MAYEAYMGGPAITLVAAADLSAKQYLFVEVDSSGLAAVSLSGADPIGVLQNKPDIGQAATVWGPGNITKMVAGAAVAKGAKVMSDGTGKAITATSGLYAAGTCLVGCANSGEVISVLLENSGKV